MAVASVYIWLPTGIEHTLGIGHGALDLTTERGDNYYITWLNSTRGGCSGSGSYGGFTSGSREASKQVGFAKIRGSDGKIIDNPNRLGSGQTYGLDDDMRKNVFRFPRYVEAGMTEAPPNYSFDVPVYHLPARNPDDNLFGVSGRRIERFWKKLLALPPGHSKRHYGALSTKQNCNGVVVEALLAGGLWMYATPPDNTIYQDARTLMRWVKKASERCHEMNEQHKLIVLSQRQAGEDGPRPLLGDQRRIPTPQQWQQESEEGIAWYGRRKEQIALLDGIIRDYHSAKAKNDRKKMFRLLLEMQTQIYDHLVRKPKSDRRAAVLSLAKRVYVVIEDLLTADDDNLQQLNPNPNQGVQAEVLV